MNLLPGFQNCHNLLVTEKMNLHRNVLKIGGASGFWGDSVHATGQLLQQSDLDFIIYDYLAEITMSLLARARARDADKGYAVSFLTEAMFPHLKTIAESGVRIVSNAGGINPRACAEALSGVIEKHGLDLKVAWIEGDDLISLKDQFASENRSEMFSGQAFPNEDKVQSINAYLGAFPVAEALDRGADIVITGRCVDSAVVLGACIHHFKWKREDLDLLAMGSLAGHLIECGTQATGGNFTDWDQVPERHNIGFPIAEIDADGSFICTKPEGTGGLVNIGTVAEQLVYEIGDPCAYVLPDVVCNVSEVNLEQLAPNRVRVTGARGYPAPANYKVSATFTDQFRAGTYLTFYGIDADKKALAYADAVFASARKLFTYIGQEDFSETSVELIGAESQFGAFSSVNDCREVVLKIAVKHPTEIGAGIMLKECGGLALATPPGLSGFGGNRPKVSPVVRLFSFLVPKSTVLPVLHIGDETIECVEPEVQAGPDQSQGSSEVNTAQSPDLSEPQQDVPLVKLAWARSGDKGDKANVGVIARKSEYFPYIDAALTEEVVSERFAHFLADSDGASVDKFQLPGIHAINFLLHDVLGGGGIASIRNDPQGKGYAQLLLTCPVSVPQSLAESLT